MILVPGTKLEGVLAGAITSTQPHVHVDYRDWNNEGEPTPPTGRSTALNSASDVELLAAPVLPTPVREVLRIDIYNADSVSATVTVKTDSGTERIIIKATLLTLESLHWETDTGWYALDANGNRKEVTSSIFSSIIVGSGAAISTLDFGTYTPTLTNGTNIAASTAYSCQYLRVGNTVTVSGEVDIDPTATGTSVLGMSLPIASNFANTGECGGVAVAKGATECFGISGNVANNRAELNGTAVDTANHGMAFTFTYRVI